VDGLSLVVSLGIVGVEGEVGVWRGRLVSAYSFRLAKSVLKGLEEAGKRTSVIEDEKDGEG
jgi:hypothetical protein